MGKRRFMASVSGDARTEVSRLGNRGVDSHTRGWNTGIEVTARPHGEYDRFEVWITGGSNNAGKHKSMMVVEETADGVYVIFQGQYGGKTIRLTD